MDLTREGMRSAEVGLVQLALGRAGFPVDVDLRFGADTRRAVAEFQRANGLAADGVVGRETWAALMPYIVGYAEHTVREGDSFWSIANMHSTSISALRTANPTLNPQNLQIGSTVIVPLDFPVVPTSVPYTSLLVRFICQGLAARYPTIRNGSIGKSVLGRDIRSLEFGVGPRRVGYNASHHANEWITTPLLLKFVEDYARAYSESGLIGGESARRLYRSTTLTVVPLVNPDGVDLVQGVIGGEAYDHAKTIASDFPQIPFPNGWKANIRGVDLNLNYPAGWENAREIKFAQGYDKPAPRDYVGLEPLSEPESAAMAELTRSQDYALILAYHTQGRVIYWKYLDYEPPTSRELAERMGEVSGYAVELTPSESGYAGYKDWFIQDWNRPGYTIEVGEGINPLPLVQFPAIYRDNLGILLLGLDPEI